MKSILLLAFGFTAFNTGLVWLVQLVHYPGFLLVGKSAFAAYHHFHMQTITRIVGPSMLLELILSLAALYYWQDLPLRFAYLFTLILLGVIWIHTALVAVPLHGQLASGDPKIMEQLITTNWWRTIAWTLRAGVLCWILYRAS